jgi:hypothetical protein
MVKSLTILGRECPVVQMSPMFPDMFACGLRYGIIEISLVIVNSGEHARVDAAVGLRGAKGETVTITEKPGLRKAIDWAEEKAKLILFETTGLVSDFVLKECARDMLGEGGITLTEHATKRNGEASLTSMTRCDCSISSQGSGLVR